MTTYIVTPSTTKLLLQGGAQVPLWKTAKEGFLICFRRGVTCSDVSYVYCATGQMNVQNGRVEQPQDFGMGTFLPPKELSQVFTVELTDETDHRWRDAIVTGEYGTLTMEKVAVVVREVSLTPHHDPVV